MSHPLPEHDYTEQTLGEQYPGVKSDHLKNKKAKIAKHMERGESKYSNLNRLAKRYDRMSRTFDSSKRGK